MTIDLAFLQTGTEHAGFSPDQARNQSPRAKRRDVFGESHEGKAASFKDFLARSLLIYLAFG